MTTINTTCARCGRQLAVPDRYLGRDLKCPSCGHPFRVDPPQGAAPTPAPPPPAPGPRTEVFPDTAPLAPPAAPFGEPASHAAQSALDASADTAFVEATAVYWRVQRVGIISLAALSALLHAVLGLVVGIAVAVASLTPAANAVPVFHGPLLGILAIVLLPVAYGVMGFVAGALAAAVYNLGARLLGGVRVLLE